MSAAAWKKGLVGALATAVVSAASVGIASLWDSYVTIDERLDSLELGQDKWRALADHENRLQEMEVTVEVHNRLVNRLLLLTWGPGTGNAKKGWFSSLQNADFPKMDVSTEPAPASSPRDLDVVEEPLPTLRKTDPESFRLQMQQGPPKK